MDASDLGVLVTDPLAPPSREGESEAGSEPDAGGAAGGIVVAIFNDPTDGGPVVTSFKGVMPGGGAGLSLGRPALTRLLYRPWGVAPRPPSSTNGESALRAHRSSPSANRSISNS